MRRRIISPVWFLACFSLLAACGSPGTLRPSPTPSMPILPASSTLFKSSGGGEPRSASYWLLWNSCAQGNQSAAARANGGRSAGWVLLDDLLEDPGVLIGSLELTACPDAVNLLQSRDLAGEEQQSDPAYPLASHLLAAQLNLAVGAETCPAAEKAVLAAQLLLLSQSFNGLGNVLGEAAGTQDYDTAIVLSDQLARYNMGELCVP